MGKPAARMGDPTAHGGAITMGFPMVLIGGMPAARMGDMHVCPMMTPAVPPIPHVGGPILLGSPMVLIGGMPAARMGDMAMCVGPPSTILMGCPTVLIGEGGSGSASGGGSGSGAAAAAAAGAATAKTDNAESFKKIEHWVEFQFTDKAGNPVSGMPYKFTDPERKETDGVLRLDGRICRDEMKQGQCKVQLFHLSNAKWSKEKANVGEKVKMSANVEGFESGTVALFQVYKRDIKGPDHAVATIEAKTQGAMVEAEWEYTLPDPSTEEEVKLRHYSSPEFYFEAIIESCKAHSGLLSYKDYLEIKLTEETGKPIGQMKYRVYLADGTIKEGTLDANGYAKIDKIQPEKVTFAIEPDWNVRHP